MNGTIFLTTFAGLLLGTSAAAQTQQPPYTAVFDDFEDGTIGSEWTVGLTLGALIHVEEENGAFMMSRTFSPLAGAFQLDVPLRWSPDPTDPVGGTSSMAVELYDQHEQVITSWTLEDANPSGAGELQVVGPTIAHLIPLQSLQGEGFMRIHRSTTGTLRFTYLGDAGPRTGMLGIVPAEVAGVRITFRHTGSIFLASPFTALELDSILLTNAITPLLEVGDLVAGRSGTLALYDATPLQVSGFAYSLTGAGPSLTPYGLADLSRPVTVLPPVVADASGQASITLALPAQASGRDIWIQGLDFGTGTLTQGVHRTIQ